MAVWVGLLIPQESRKENPMSESLLLVLTVVLVALVVGISIYALWLRLMLWTFRQMFRRLFPDGILREPSKSAPKKGGANMILLWIVLTVLISFLMLLVS
jgi:flagellar basal body-associated protein FliL